MILRPLVALGRPGGCVQAVLRPPAALTGLGVLSGPLCDAFLYLHAYLFGFVFTAFFFYMHAVFITNLYWHADDTTNMVTDPVN